ncbi:MAG: preQ(1) synthase [Candidatus Margulisbacteria bacterium]|nr:preQ(1) synthase [Candidatus Margulisiibacteriota bacterium]MBU1617214.1 preQ(1) synthase [Candidatus Margulisiibacteriota bacterium]
MGKKNYEGLQKNVKELKLPPIDTWENQYADREYAIHIETDEFTCVCPKTGLPDFATIIIEYSPNKRCLELKSLKEYFFAYRDIGIFHEHLTNKILADIVAAANPRSAKVTAEMKVRGGIKTSVTAEYPPAA